MNIKLLRSRNLALKTVILFCALFTGCHSVDVSKLNLARQSANSCLHIYVTDERPYILSKDKDPNFVGIVRGGYGNPFDFSSSSGNSLAKDLGLAIQQSLNASGGARYIDGAFARSNSERCKTLLLSYKEWKIDSFVDAWFMYDAQLSVYSATGSVLGSTAGTDKRAVSGSFLNPLGAARNNFLQETTTTLNALLSNTNINKALAK